MFSPEIEKIDRKALREMQLERLKYTVHYKNLQIDSHIFLEKAPTFFPNIFPFLFLPEKLLCMSLSSTYLSGNQQ